MSAECSVKGFAMPFSNTYTVGVRDENKNGTVRYSRLLKPAQWVKSEKTI